MRGNEMMHGKVNVFIRVFNSLLFCALLSLSCANTANARFLTPDTWDPIIAGVDFNRYAYGANDPINKSDPNGHTWQGLDSLFSTKSTRGVEKANERAQELIRQERKGLANLEKAYRESDMYQDDYYNFVRSEKLRSIGQYQNFLNGKYDDLRNQMLPNAAAGIAQGAGLAGVIRGGIANGANKGLPDRAASNLPASKKVHGNSLESEKPTVGYSLTCTICGKTQKFGETSATKPIDRYSGRFYERNNLRMDEGTAATSKPAAREWQTHEIRNYINQNGHLPPMNRGMH